MNKRTVEYWQTVSIAGLAAGYRNVYQGDNEIFIYPCPAILIQELREISHCHDVPKGDGTFRLSTRDEKLTPPYETRLVFADTDGRDIEPACDSANYIKTLVPGEE